MRRRSPAGLCAPCVRRLAARVPEPVPPTLADELARARERIAARRAALEAERERRRAMFGETDAPRTLGRAAGARRSEDW